MEITLDGPESGSEEIQVTMSPIDLENGQEVTIDEDEEIFGDPST